MYHTARLLDSYREASEDRAEIIVRGDDVRPYPNTAGTAVPGVEAETVY